MTTSSTVFADVPHDARGHLGLLFYAAAFHLIYYLRCCTSETSEPLEAVLDKFPFLSSYFAEMRARLPEEIEWGETLEWLRGQISAWEATAADSRLPLVAMRDALQLSYAGLLAFIFTGMVEEKAEFGTLFAALQPNGKERRATLGLIQRLIESEQTPETWTLVRPLVDGAFVEVINRDAPRSEWILRIPAMVWNAVRGETPRAPLEKVHFHPVDSLDAMEDLIIDPALREKLQQLAVLARTRRVTRVVARGMPGTDRLGAIGSIARELGCGVMEIECSAAPAPENDCLQMIGPLCTLTGSIPVFSVEAGHGETFEVPALKGYAGPAAVMLGIEGGVAASNASHAVTLQLDLESVSHREEIWRRALHAHGIDTVSDANLPRIARTFCLPSRHIRQCAQLAGDYAALEQRQTVSISDVRWAARALNRQALDTLAHRIDGNADWENLIVNENTSRELRALEQRCRHREQLAVTFNDSVPGGMNRGVRALFEGASGTGKTLAARVIAGELGLDLYRVDLASVVNKFVGETEKNLSRVLSRAEDLNVILLLDEGDSLMSRRTEVKSANDRFANLETNYLLQRLESYTGIVFVTTNAGQAIDSAFRRRMDAVVKFHEPDTAERWRLWQAHLPGGHFVDGRALEEIALRYEMTGGQIRNVCINAELGALSHGDRRVELHHLREAIQAEHRKAGASFVETITPVRARNEMDLAAFLGGLT